MPEPRRSSPLSRYADHFAAVGDRAAMREIPFQTQISLRGDPDDTGFTTVVREVVGCDLPTGANTVLRNGHRQRSILWLGPDEWLIVGEEGSEVGAELTKAFSDRHVSVLDASANRVIIEISGPGAREVLARGCSLDLHPREFATDQCAQTLLAQVQIILEQTTNAPTFRIYVRPSFSRYLADWLLNAVSEFAVHDLVSLAGR